MMCYTSKYVSLHAFYGFKSLAPMIKYSSPISRLTTKQCGKPFQHNLVMDYGGNTVAVSS